MQRMRILIVTRNLPPLVGGMERLNWHMAEQLSKAAEVRVVGPAGAAAWAPPGVAVREAPLQPLWKFLLHARKLARLEARRWGPEIVLAGSGLAAPIARSAARVCGAKTCVYVHGLDVAVRHAVYRACWLPAIRRADRVIANSNTTAALCRDIGVDPARVGVVHPGVDLPDAPPLFDERGQGEGADSRGGPTAVEIPARHHQPRTAEPRTEFRERHSLADRPLLLSVGRLSARKGLREFVGDALPRIVAVWPKVLLIIVGDAPVHALYAKAQTQDSIRAVAKSAGVADHIRFLGTISERDLDAAYAAANVHVFPVREMPGDPEGFGMVAVEAAAHGVPTVAYAVGGVVDAVENGTSGRLVRAGDPGAFALAVIELLRQPPERSRVREFAERFAWPRFRDKLCAELERA
ncbi:MAG: glycosyltransferase family 4 protein [Gammaproteobacteria bacterium]|nr:glycosyltransferase family 4 protein [Gammaproteobacteria bacterium]